jgi:hypothetical protein
MTDNRATESLAAKMLTLAEELENFGTERDRDNETDNAAQAASAAAYLRSAYKIRRTLQAAHTEATPSQALAEVVQLLHGRWRAAWDEWAKLAPKSEDEPPSELCRRAWSRMEQALSDMEAIAELGTCAADADTRPEEKK